MSIHIPLQNHAAASASSIGVKQEEINSPIGAAIPSLAAAAGIMPKKGDQNMDSFDERQLHLSCIEADKKIICELAAKNSEIGSCLQKVQKQMEKLQEQADSFQREIRERKKEIAKLDDKIKLRESLLKAIEDIKETSSPLKRKIHQDSVRNRASLPPHYLFQEAAKEKPDKRQRTGYTESSSGKNGFTSDTGVRSAPSARASHADAAASSSPYGRR